MKTIVLLLATVSIHAGVIYSDIGTPAPGFTTSAGYGGPFPINVGMRFVAEVSGVVSGYIAPLSTAGSDLAANFQLFSDVAGQPGVVLDSLVFSISPTPSLVTASSSTDPLLTAGTAYWLISGFTVSQRVLWFDSFPAVTGSVWASGAGVEDQQSLAAFAVQGSPGSEVPEPLAIPLLGSGILGLLCLQDVLRK